MSLFIDLDLELIQDIEKQNKTSKQTEIKNLRAKDLVSIVI